MRRHSLILHLVVGGAGRAGLVRTPSFSIPYPTSCEGLSPSVLRLHLRRGAAREVQEGRHRCARKECRIRDPARPDIYSHLTTGTDVPCEWSGEKQGCMHSHHAGRHPHLDIQCGRHHQPDALVRSALACRQHDQYSSLVTPIVTRALA